MTNDRRLALALSALLRWLSRHVADHPARSTTRPSSPT